jgi:SPP1 family predicted phage head-tail adaptor
MKIGATVTNPGELRTLVKFERRAITTQTGGFQTESWSEIAEVYAKWENVHGSEVWAAASMQARRPATVLARYRADINKACAVSMGGDRYQILSIDNIQNRGEYMELKVQRMEAS